MHVHEVVNLERKGRAEMERGEKEGLEGGHVETKIEGKWQNGRGRERALLHRLTLLLAKKLFVYALRYQAASQCIS